jgi:hypothetical protein
LCRRRYDARKTLETFLARLRDGAGRVERGAGEFDDGGDATGARLEVAIPRRLLRGKQVSQESHMDLTTFAQLVPSVPNIISVLVIALGHYFIVRTNQRTLEVIRAQRLAGGRPTVIVSDKLRQSA